VDLFLGGQVSTILIYQDIAFTCLKIMFIEGKNQGNPDLSFFCDNPYYHPVPKSICQSVRKGGPDQTIRQTEAEARDRN
jgi:hypothetical protein